MNIFTWSHGTRGLSSR